MNPFLRVLVDEENTEGVNLRRGGGGGVGGAEGEAGEGEGGEVQVGKEEEEKYRCSENVSAADENKGCNSELAHC